MTLKNKNPWKYLSVGLLGVIGIGLLAPVDAASGNANSGWQAAVADLQSQIDSIVSQDFQAQIDALVLALSGESSTRAADDATLQSNIDSESATRANADTVLSNDLTAHVNADGDLSDTNELQTLTRVGNALQISNGNTVSLPSGGGGSLPCNGCVKSSDIAFNTIVAGNIATGGVGSAEIADNSVRDYEIAANAVGNSEMKNNAIGSAEIINGAITSGDLANNSVSSLKIVDNSITASDIAADAVGASEIAANAVGASEIGINAVGAQELQNIQLNMFPLGSVHAKVGNTITADCPANKVMTGITLVENSNNVVTLSIRCSFVELP